MSRQLHVPTKRARRFSPLVVESLETRALMSVSAAMLPTAHVVLSQVHTPRWKSHEHYQSMGHTQPAGLEIKAIPFQHHAPKPSRGHSPSPSPTPTPVPAPPSAYSGSYSPSQVRHAYGIDQLNLTGAGQTIAIVAAYDDPTIASDLHKFDQRFGLADPTFVKATPGGLPAYDAGWSSEIALDVEWAHVIAPGAKILLVEAASSSLDDLMTAVDYAVNQGAKQVSMSWGGSESYWSPSYDARFNHPGVTFTAASGDSGAGASYPAASPFVTAIGGTRLSIDSAGNRLAETAWKGSGGAPSRYENLPPYQSGFVTGRKRGMPDVSYNADPSTGVTVYDSASGGWIQVGGTSAGTPQWAGLIALVNQGRALAGKASLGTAMTYGTNQALYALAGGSSYTNTRGDFIDVTSGGNGYPATRGYDYVTGLGSPVANKLVPDLVNGQ